MSGVGADEAGKVLGMEVLIAGQYDDNCGEIVGTTVGAKLG